MRREPHRRRKKNQRVEDGSVEKYRAPEDHDVVSPNDESEFADLSPAEEKVSGTAL
jgi:hypothetical protein